MQVEEINGKEEDIDIIPENYNRIQQDVIRIREEVEAMLQAMGNDYETN